MRFDEWAERLKGPFPTRRARLQHIASSPCDRQDVQAARRLLCKPRYGMNGHDVLRIIQKIPLPARDDLFFREMILALDANKSLPVEKWIKDRIKFVDMLTESR